MHVVCCDVEPPFRVQLKVLKKRGAVVVIFTNPKAAKGRPKGSGASSGTLFLNQMITKPKSPR